MEQALKDGLLDWLTRYRAATGEQQSRLAAQVEAHNAFCASAAEEAWLDVVLGNMGTTVPIELVRQRADLAYAETRALLSNITAA